MTTTITGPRHDSDWDAPSGEALAAQLSRRGIRRRIAFWLLAFVFAAVLAFSALLAVLCLFSLARIATALAPDPAASR